MGINQDLLHKSMGKIVPLQQVIEAKNGEVVVTINLNLTIKLDDEGKVSLSNASAEARPVAPFVPVSKKEEKVQFEMPDLEDNTGELLPDFGR